MPERLITLSMRSSRKAQADRDGSISGGQS